MIQWKVSLENPFAIQFNLECPTCRYKEQKQCRTKPAYGDYDIAFLMHWTAECMTQFKCGCTQ